MADAVIVPPVLEIRIHPGLPTPQLALALLDSRWQEEHAEL